MSDQAGLLRALLDQPDEDVHRLVYADWLEDNGGPEGAARAEFIRVQHALAELPPGDPSGAPLLRREGELLASHEAAWRASLPQIEGVTWQDLSRGFVEAAFVTDVPTLLSQATAIFAAAPIVRLRIGTIDEDAAHDLGASPWLSRLRELNLGNNPALGERGVAALAGSPHLKGLRGLLLHYCALGDEAMARLAHAFALPCLTELYLSGNDLGNGAAFALAGSTNFPRLTDLDLRDNQIGNAGARALAHQSCLEGLVTLYLVNNRIGAEGAEALAFSGCLPRLARLYLNYNPVGDEGAAAFAASPRRTALRELDLRNCEIRRAGGRAVTDSVHLDALETIWLGGNRLPSEVLTALRQRFGRRVRF